MKNILLICLLFTSQSLLAEYSLVLPSYKEVVKCNSCYNDYAFESAVMDLPTKSIGKYFVFNTNASIGAEVQLTREGFLWDPITITSSSAYSLVYNSKLTPLRDIPNGVPMYFTSTFQSYQTFNREVVARNMQRAGLFFRATPFAPINLPLGTIVTVVFKNGDKIDFVLTTMGEIHWSVMWETAVDKDGKSLASSGGPSGGGQSSGGHATIFLIRGTTSGGGVWGSVVTVNCNTNPEICEDIEDN